MQGMEKQQPAALRARQAPIQRYPENFVLVTSRFGRMQNGSEWERDGECYGREAALLEARRERLTLTHKSIPRGTRKPLGKDQEGRYYA